MFVNNARILDTSMRTDNQGPRGYSDFIQLSTRVTKTGHILFKDLRGTKIAEIKSRKTDSDPHLLFNCRQRVNGVSSRVGGRIDSKLISERIVAYAETYYGTHITNCSTFAEYLSTGKFKECGLNGRDFMFSGGLTRYIGQKVKPGDVLCILYYKKIADNRRVPKTKKHYRKCEKMAKEGLATLKAKSPQVFSPEKFVEEYNCGLYADYHFMVCIDIVDGSPVFIQQLGRHVPGKRETSSTPIVVSIGMINLSQHNVPAALFIKRGRK